MEEEEVEVERKRKRDSKKTDKKQTRIFFVKNLKKGFQFFFLLCFHKTRQDK